MADGSHSKSNLGIFCTVRDLFSKGLDGEDQSMRAAGPPPIWLRTTLPEPQDQRESQAPLTMDPGTAHGPVSELPRAQLDPPAQPGILGWRWGNCFPKPHLDCFAASSSPGWISMPLRSSCRPELISPHCSMLRRPSADGTQIGRPAANSRFTRCQFQHPQTRIGPRESCEPRHGRVTLAAQATSVSQVEMQEHSKGKFDVAEWSVVARSRVETMSGVPQRPLTAPPSSSLLPN